MVNKPTHFVNLNKFEEVVNHRWKKCLTESADYANQMSLQTETDHDPLGRHDRPRTGRRPVFGHAQGRLWLPPAQRWRPHPITLADYEAAFESMAQTIAENAEEDAKRAALALTCVQAEIAALEADHGIDHATALRWWYAAEGVETEGPYGAQDREHVLWKRGIAFRDFPLFGESAY